MKPLPQPPPEVVGVWAKLLNLGVEVVVEMMTVIQNESQPAEVTTSSQAHHLPTPGMSTSPEPNHEDDSTDLKHEPPISPIIAFNEPPSWLISTDATTTSTVAAPSVGFQHTAVFDRQEVIESFPNINTIVLISY